MKYIYFFAIVLLFASCGEMDLEGLVSYPEKLSDQRFNGTFSRSTPSPGGYFHSYDAYAFNRTAEVLHTYQSTYSSTYSYYTYEWQIQFDGASLAGTQTNPGKYRHKIHNNQYSNWTDWQNYYFSADGKELYLGYTLSTGGSGYMDYDYF